MAFKVEIENLNGEGTKVIMPISMDQKYHTGERFRALVEAAKKFNTTLLIADTLQRHNVGSKQKAIAKGRKFLSKYSEVLKECVTINGSDDWSTYKNDGSIVKIVSWDVWALIKEHELREADILVEKIAQPESLLFQIMCSVAENSLSAQNKETSIAFQKEEIKYLLTFSDFDAHVYPKSLNDSQNAAYRFFYDQGFLMPRLLIPSFISISLSPHHIADAGIFSNAKRKQAVLPVALRLHLNHIQDLLQSPEISWQVKQSFITQLDQILHPNSEIKKNSSTGVNDSSHEQDLSSYVASMH